MKTKMLDLVFIDETHLRKGNNVDLSVFSPYTPIFLERDFGMKMGGGKMILHSERMIASEWSPNVEENEWVKNERHGF